MKISNKPKEKGGDNLWQGMNMRQAQRKQKNLERKQKKKQNRKNKNSKRSTKTRSKSVQRTKKKQIKMTVWIAIIFLALLTISYRNSQINIKFNEIQNQKRNQQHLKKKMSKQR